MGVRSHRRPLPPDAHTALPGLAPGCPGPKPGTALCACLGTFNCHALHFPIRKAVQTRHLFSNSPQSPPLPTLPHACFAHLLYSRA